MYLGAGIAFSHSACSHKQWFAYMEIRAFLAQNELVGRGLYRVDLFFRLEDLGWNFLHESVLFSEFKGNVGLVLSYSLNSLDLGLK